MKHPLFERFEGLSNELGHTQAFILQALERARLTAVATEVDRFGQCALHDAPLSERIEAASALLLLEDPQHLKQALFDAGLYVINAAQRAVIAACKDVPREAIGDYGATPGQVWEPVRKAIRAMREAQGEVFERYQRPEPARVTVFGPVGASSPEFREFVAQAYGPKDEGEDR